MRRSPDRAAVHLVQGQARLRPGAWGFVRGRLAGRLVARGRGRRGRRQRAVQPPRPVGQQLARPTGRGVRHEPDDVRGPELADTPVRRKSDGRKGRRTQGRSSLPRGRREARHLARSKEVQGQAQGRLARRRKTSSCLRTAVGSSQAGAQSRFASPTPAIRGHGRSTTSTSTPGAARQILEAGRLDGAVLAELRVV